MLGTERGRLRQVVFYLLLDLCLCSTDEIPFNFLNWFNTF